MENTNQEAETNCGDSSAAENVKFDPSDFLPRRTSRASAHAASHAIKKSVITEKSDPCKPLEEEPSEASKAAPPKPVVREKPKPKSKRSVPYSDNDSSGEESSSQAKYTRYGCYIKLVRCENDPELVDVLKQQQQQQQQASANSNSSNKASCSVGTDLDQDSDCEFVGEEVLPVKPKPKKMKAKLDVNGEDPNSKYEIVFAPTYYKEQYGLKHDSQAGMKKVASEKDLVTRPSGPKVREASSGTAKGTQQKSLSLVVVHPKPGSTIVNSNKGQASRSNVLQQMINDPSTVISNNVSRVVTTGGSSELRCSLCCHTFVVARDLINHKRLVHRCKDVMCITCAGNFPSGEELQAHICPAKYRCDICGVVCKKPGALFVHKSMAHKTSVGGYMCYKCCFNADTQYQLDTHPCGGNPVRTPVKGYKNHTVMVYPKTGLNKATPSKSKSKSKSAASATSSKNIYVSIPHTEQGVGFGGVGGAGAPIDVDSAGPSGDEGKFLCEVCLQMFPSSTMLDSHKCGQPSFNPNSSAVALNPAMRNPVVPPPVPPLAMQGGFEVLSEVEQLAKFYSSVVFHKDAGI